MSFTQSIKRLGLISVLLCMISALIYYIFFWFTEGRYILSTDDAYVKADITNLSSRVPGFIVTVSVLPQAFVKKDEILLRLDAGDYQLAVDLARAKIATQETTIQRVEEQGRAQLSVIDQTEAKLQMARATFDLAEVLYGRKKALAQNNVETQASLDQAYAEKVKAKAGIQEAEAGIHAAQSQLTVLKAEKAEAEKSRAELQRALEKAERDLSYILIRAPADGFIGHRIAQPGQYVLSGTRLMAFVPIDSFYIEANFKETQIGPLKIGQKALLSIDSYPDQILEGVVESISPASGAEFSLLPPDNAVGNFTKIIQRVPVRIRVQSQNKADIPLRAGLSVLVKVDTRT